MGGTVTPRAHSARARPLPSCGLPPPRARRAPTRRARALYVEEGEGREHIEMGGVPWGGVGLARYVKITPSPKLATRTLWKPRALLGGASSSRLRHARRASAAEALQSRAPDGVHMYVYVHILYDVGCRCRNRSMSTYMYINMGCRCRSRSMSIGTAW